MTTDTTTWVDPETWLDRLYDPAQPDTYSAAEPETDDDAVDAELVDEGEHEHEQAEPDEQPEETRPRPQHRWRVRRQAQAEPGAAPVFTKTAPARQRPGVDLARRLRWRTTLYTGSAAAAGWSLGAEQHAEHWLRDAAVAPAGMAALLLAGGAGYAAWTASRRIALPHPMLARPIAVAVAASVGDSAAHPAVHFLAEHGVSPGAVLPLATGVALIGALRHFVDRRTRGWWPPLAWVMRIPLASASLALVLYH